MQKFKINLPAVLFGIIMLTSGLLHFLNPKIYSEFIPDFLPETGINYLIGLVEIALAIGLFNLKLRGKAALGVFVLMIFFLPFHFIDMFKDQPAIGSKEIAYVRFGIQLILIYWTYTIWKKMLKAK